MPPVIPVSRLTCVSAADLNQHRRRNFQPGPGVEKEHNGNYRFPLLSGRTDIEPPAVYTLSQRGDEYQLANIMTGESSNAEGRFWLVIGVASPNVVHLAAWSRVYGPAAVSSYIAVAQAGSALQPDLSVYFAGAAHFNKGRLNAWTHVSEDYQVPVWAHASNLSPQALRLLPAQSFSRYGHGFF